MFANREGCTDEHFRNDELVDLRRRLKDVFQKNNAKSVEEPKSELFLPTRRASDYRFDFATS